MSDKGKASGSVQRLRVVQFRYRLRESRLSSGFSQAELANETGLMPSAIAHFEAGRRTPSIHNLYALCVALGCPSDFLLALPPLEQAPNHELTDATKGDSNG